MTGERKRILLVEDDPKDVELTLEALSENNLGNAVDVAGDGENALEYLRRRGPRRIRRILVSSGRFIGGNRCRVR